MALGDAVLAAGKSGVIQNLISGTIASGTTTSNVISGGDNWKAYILHFKIASVTGTAPTWDIYVQQLAADGTTWYDISHGAQVSTNGSYMTHHQAGGANAAFTATDATLGASTFRTILFAPYMRVKVVCAGSSAGGTVNLGIQFLDPVLR